MVSEDAYNMRLSPTLPFHCITMRRGMQEKDTFFQKIVGIFQKHGCNMRRFPV